MDDVDRAEKNEELIHNAELERIRAEAAKPSVSTGFCLNCGEPIHQAGRRWCCAACRDQWEKENAR